MRYNSIMLYFLSDDVPDYGARPMCIIICRTDRLKCCWIYVGFFYYVELTDIKIFFKKLKIFWQSIVMKNKNYKVKQQSFGRKYWYNVHIGLKP